MKYLFKIIRKISLSFGILYGYNLLMQSFNLPIPINLITVGITFFLGIPGFIGLIIFFMINFMWGSYAREVYRKAKCSN